MVTVAVNKARKTETPIAVHGPGPRLLPPLFPVDAEGAGEVLVGKEVGFDDANASRAVVAEYSNSLLPHDKYAVAPSSKMNWPHVGEAIGLGKSQHLSNI